VFGLALALLAACGGSASSGSGATSEPAESAAASGYVTVQGHELAYDCVGQGSPTVIFLHGLGGAAVDWAATARLTGVHSCRFDRVNAGDSEHADERHQATDSVAELHDFAAAAGLSPPFVLAAHSFGGLIAMMYAATYPDDVSALLLADTSLPLEADLDAQYLPPDQLETLRRDINDNPELVDAYEAYAQTAALLPRLPDVPITYMWGTLQEGPPEWPAGAYEAGLRAFMDGIPQGRLVESTADHDIPRDIPEQVVTELELLLGE